MTDQIRRDRYAAAIAAVDEHSCQTQDGVDYLALADVVMLLADSELAAQKHSNAIAVARHWKEAADRLNQENARLRAESEKARTLRLNVYRQTERNNRFQDSLNRSAEHIKELSSENARLRAAIERVRALTDPRFGITTRLVPAEKILAALEGNRR